MRNFQVSIVSAVKMCKQCLQTASASIPGPSIGASPLDPAGKLPSPGLVDYSSQMKISAVTNVSLPVCNNPSSH